MLARLIRFSLTQRLLVLVLTLILAGVTFVVSLVILATLLIAVGPKIDHDRVDPVDPDAPSGSAGSVHRDPMH